MPPIPFQPPGSPISYFPSLSPHVGGSNAAILLCQLIYWTPRAKDPDGWIYKTQLELVVETGLTRDEQRSARKALKDKGLLRERYDRLGHQLYFQINLEAYNAIIQGLYDCGEGEEGGPKPWKINEIRKPYMGKYGNHTSRNTVSVRRDIRKPSVAKSSEIPENTAETHDGVLSHTDEETASTNGHHWPCGIHGCDRHACRHQQHCAYHSERCVACMTEAAENILAVVTAQQRYGGLDVPAMLMDILTRTFGAEVAEHLLPRVKWEAWTPRLPNVEQVASVLW